MGTHQSCEIQEDAGHCKAKRQPAVLGNALSLCCLLYTSAKYRHGKRSPNRIVFRLALSTTCLLYTSLLYTGLRRGEALALQWNDIDEEAGIIHVWRSLDYAGKNNGNFKEPKTEAGKRRCV